MLSGVARAGSTEDGVDPSTLVFSRPGQEWRPNTSRAQGFKVVHHAPAPLRSGFGEVHPAQIYDSGLAGRAPSSAEALVIGGNGLRAIGAIEALEADLGRPVLTAKPGGIVECAPPRGRARARRSLRAPVRRRLSGRRHEKGNLMGGQIARRRCSRDRSSHCSAVRKLALGAWEHRGSFGRRRSQPILLSRTHRSTLQHAHLSARTVEAFIGRMKGLAEQKPWSFHETLLGSEVRVFGNVAVAVAACEMTENGDKANLGGRDVAARQG